MIIGGGCQSEYSPRIAKYTLDKWTEVGNLQKARNGIRAILNDNRMYVVGGAGVPFEFRTEIWSLDENDNTVNMKLAEPKLREYKYYPELFVVPSNFCTKN